MMFHHIKGSVPADCWCNVCVNTSQETLYAQTDTSRAGVHYYVAVNEPSQLNTFGLIGISNSQFVTFDHRE